MPYHSDSLRTLYCRVEGGWLVNIMSFCDEKNRKKGLPRTSISLRPFKRLSNSPRGLDEAQWKEGLRVEFDYLILTPDCGLSPLCFLRVEKQISFRLIERDHLQEWIYVLLRWCHALFKSFLRLILLHGKPLLSTAMDEFTQKCKVHSSFSVVR